MNHDDNKHIANQRTEDSFEHENQFVTRLDIDLLKRSLRSKASNDRSCKCWFYLGTQENGEPFFTNLDTIHNMVLCGDPGRGKSTVLKLIIQSMMLALTPADLQIVVIVLDRKEEYSFLNNSPFQYEQIMTDEEDHDNLFARLNHELQNRNRLLYEDHSKDIYDYNQKHPNDRIPHILIILDNAGETIRKEIENSFRRTGKSSHYANTFGFHWIIATQIIKEWGIDNLLFKMPTKAALYPVEKEHADWLGFHKPQIITQPYQLLLSSAFFDKEIVLKIPDIKQLTKDNMPNTITEGKIAGSMSVPIEDKKIENEQSESVLFSEKQIIKLSYDNNENQVADLSRSESLEFDFFTLLLNDKGSINSDSDLVFYNNLHNETESVRAHGDCVSGCSDCLIDSVYFNFNKIPKSVNKIIVLIRRYRGFLDENRNQPLGFKAKPHDRLVINYLPNDTVCHPFDDSNHIEICFDREEYLSDLCHICTLTKKESIWRLSIVAEAIKEPLEKYLSYYNINV